MKHIPNLLTLGRLVLTLAVFLALCAGAVGLCDALAIYSFAFWGFVIAAVTDFLDGWLARRWQVESLAGAILDPIADKVLVAGAVVGLAANGDQIAALAGGLILFREFAVSALREVLAPRGLRLPVTMLAKWKTTLQLVALAAALLRLAPPPWLTGPVSLGVDVALWLAALVTVWTGVEYGLAARKALRAAS
ncbi:MAG: CDP-diacylglycerol--glycerol-3-phosphate 3-phosphatidyltransferase [Caulobacter sp.]|nr:CDP-diacylglycerol--glycerol-3-phosphate 3-phosphatidyltransferase [Caulobacter sp.]